MRVQVACVVGGSLPERTRREEVMALQPAAGSGSGERQASALASVEHVLSAVITTVVPAAATLTADQWRSVRNAIDRSLQDRPAALQRQLRLLLLGIQWLSMLRYGRVFTALAEAQRARVFRYLQGHRLELVRVGFWGLRTIALLGYYGRPEAARLVGYSADARGWEALA